MVQYAHNLSNVLEGIGFVGAEREKEKEINVCFPSFLLSQSEMDDFPSNINTSFQSIINHQRWGNYNKFIMNMENINK